MDWNKYFEKMVEWKKLPAYRAEPRIDSFIGFYLPSILSYHLKVEIEGVIPEFPLHIGIVKPNNAKTRNSELSCKVDFLAIGSNDKNYLVEFKTDMLYLKGPQKEYLQQAQNVGTGALIMGLTSIYKKSKFKPKYDCLITKLHDYGLLINGLMYTGKNPDLKIVYILPSENETIKDAIMIKFDQIAKWFEDNFSEPGSFERIFAATLRKWGND